MQQKLIVIIAMAMLSTAMANKLRLDWPWESNMVVQRGHKIPVRGTAPVSSNVLIAFNKQQIKAQADSEGRWQVNLAPMKAGGPYNIIIKAAGQTEIYYNIMIGDVWFVSGQSNMARPTKVCRDAQEWLKDANYPNIRMCTLLPKRDRSNPKWESCNAETAAEFSATAFLFARELRKTESIPIGLLNASHDGSIIRKWISEEALLAIPHEKKKLETYQATLPDRRKKLNDYIAEHNRRKKLPAAEEAKLPKLKHPGIPYRTESSLYNQRVKPILPFPIKGAVWYQGESDAMFSMGGKYRNYLELLITSWRKEFGCGDFPFIIVQLPNFAKSHSWAIIRDCQRTTAAKVPKTKLAVTIDVGESNDIHPNDKLSVGKRVALCAKRIAYGRSVSDQGPVFKSMQLRGSRAVLEFGYHAGSLLLKTKGNKVTSSKLFQVAGANKKFQPAQVRIEGNKLIVWSDRVQKPAAVRYAWTQDPQDGLLYGANGLPASPFRTDKWRVHGDW